jgi:catechol 2,3-dioxygenase-like lactoylglutathione lyase family enzyme
MIKRIWDVTLTVSDLLRAVHFYEDILGLKKKYQFKDYAGFDCAGVELGLRTWGERENPRQGEPCVEFAADDVDEAFRVLKSKGVVFTAEPKDTLWGGRVASFFDPDGNSLQLVEIDWAKYFSVCAPK